MLERYIYAANIESIRANLYTMIRNKDARW